MRYYLHLLCQYGISDGFHCGLHGTRQAIANTVARLDAHVKPAFHHAWLVTACAETGSVKQTEHQAKLGVFVFLQHTAEVKLYIGELHQLSRVADDSQDLSVADDAIYILQGASRYSSIVA